MPKLNRSLGLTECIFFGVGSILGAGIYALVGKVAGVSGNYIWFSFFIASAAALLSAFSYAELSSYLPKAGGEYVYVSKAFGKKMGIILGFVISFNGIVSGATISLGFAGYLISLIGINASIASLGIILLIFSINIAGIRESSIINIIFTIIEAGGLFFVIFASASALGSINYLEMPKSGYGGIAAASALAFFAFIGFEEIVKLAEETKQPEKTIPKALFITGAIVFVIYTLVSLCAVSVIPYDKLGASTSPLADVVNVSYGTFGVITISVIALFSTSNTILSNMLGSSRVLLNMAKENKPLKIFSHISKSRGTPYSALLFILAVMVLFSFIGNIETVARITTMLIFITFIFVNLSLIVIRIKHPKEKHPYRVPFNIKNIPVPSILGIITAIGLLIFNIYSL